MVRDITDGRARVLVTPCTSEPPAADKRAETRSDWDLDGRLVVGWVGSFRRFHHVDMLIRSMARLPREFQNLTLFLIGDGPTRADSQQLANELGLDCRFTGSVLNTDVLGLLQGCDIGVLPSASGEEFHYSPLKLKEYMAAGVPSVVPRLGEMSRTMTESIDVLFYDPGNEEDLARQVRRLALEPEVRRSIAAAGRALLMKDFSMANQLVEIERSLELL